MIQDIEFEVEGLPPSYNKMIQVNFNFKSVYLSKEAQYFKQKVYQSTPKIELDLSKKYIMDVHIEYWGEWICKNGNVRRKDIQNMDKLIIDAICDKLGIDDSYVWANHNYKMPMHGETHDSLDRIVVKIKFLKEVAYEPTK